MLDQEEFQAVQAGNIIWEDYFFLKIDDVYK